MSIQSTCRTLVIVSSLLVGSHAVFAQSTTSPSTISSVEIDQIVAQIRANPAEMSTLVRAAIIRDPNSAPILARRLIASFPDQIRVITSTALTAVQDSGVAESATLIENTAVAAAEAAVALGGEFAVQQVNVAAVAQGVQDVVQVSDAPPVVASVNAVLEAPTTETNDTPAPVVGTPTEEIIPPPPETPDQTSPTDD